MPEVRLGIDDWGSIADVCQGLSKQSQGAIIRKGEEAEKRPISNQRRALQRFDESRQFFGDVQRFVPEWAKLGLICVPSSHPMAVAASNDERDVSGASPTSA